MCSLLLEIQARTLSSVTARPRVRVPVHQQVEDNATLEGDPWNCVYSEARSAKPTTTPWPRHSSRRSRRNCSARGRSSRRQTRGLPRSASWRVRPALTALGARLLVARQLREETHHPATYYAKLANGPQTGSSPPTCDDQRLSRPRKMRDTPP